jgi:hypothetical protein
MSGFLDPLELELMRDSQGRPLLTRQGRQLYKVLSRFRYLSDVADLVDVPAGYVTDLCSQPQATMSLLGECAQEPSVPHDYAYSTHCMTRATADRMLYEACRVTGIPRWKAALIYAGVRVGGGSRWGPDPSPSNGGPPHRILSASRSVNVEK